MIMKWKNGKRILERSLPIRQVANLKKIPNFLQYSKKSFFGTIEAEKWRKLQFFLRKNNIERRSFM